MLSNQIKKRRTGSGLNRSRSVRPNSAMSAVSIKSQHEMDLKNKSIYIHDNIKPIALRGVSNSHTILPA